MEIIHYPDDPTPLEWRQPVLALGNFDGLHRGHLKIIDRVRHRATEVGVKSAILTFDPHPPRIVRPDKASPLLMTQATEARVSGEGRDRRSRGGPIYTGDVALGARGVRRDCPRRLAIASRRSGWGRTFSSVVTGAATSHSSGNSGCARASESRRSIPVRYKEFVVSSTRIRRLIAEGQVDEAGALLGHHYVD